MPFSLPPLPGPNINGSRQLPVTLPLPHPGGQTGVISFPRNAQSQLPSASTASTLARPYPPPTQRIPQVDGPSDSSGEEDSPSPTGAFAPRTAHPSLPQPPAPPQSQPTSLDSEAINSDLDDSDTEGEDDDEEGAAGETDIVFCTYDKVFKILRPFYRSQLNYICLFRLPAWRTSGSAPSKMVWFMSMERIIFLQSVLGMVYITPNMGADWHIYLENLNGKSYFWWLKSILFNIIAIWMQSCPQSPSCSWTHSLFWQLRQKKILLHS